MPVPAYLSPFFLLNRFLDSLICFNVSICSASLDNYGHDI